MTVEEFANLLEVPSRTVSSYERGEHTPPASYLKLLNDKLNVNINYLLSGKGSVFLSKNHECEYEKIVRQEYNLSERDIKLLKIITDFLNSNK